MSEERQPTYEELQARVAELRIRDRLAEAHVARINNEERPLNRTLLGLLLQMSRSLTGGSRPATVNRTVYFVEDGVLVTNYRDFGALSGPELVPGDDPASVQVREWAATVQESETPVWSVLARWPMGSHSPVARAAQERRTIHVPDVDAEAVTYPDFADRREQIRRRFNPDTQLMNYTLVCTPMLLAGELLGVLWVSHISVHPFIPEEISLIERTADQMALAIGNARLAEQLEQRNRELAEALEQQTGVAEVLRIIASSPAQLGDTLSAVIESAARLVGAQRGVITRIAGETEATFRMWFVVWGPEWGPESDARQRMVEGPRAQRSPAVESMRD